MMEGQLYTDTHKHPSNCFCSTLQNGDFVQTLHTHMDDY